MNYKSPIELIAGQIETEMENEIVKAVQRVGININKAELMRALTYDRNQYVRGYYDRDSEIVRCKDCKWYKEGYDIDGKWFTRCNGDVRVYGHTKPDWYCADAERRETNDKG